MKRGVHNEKIKAKIKGSVFAIRCECGNANKEIANNLGDELDIIVCHEQAILSREFGGGEFKLFHAIGANNVHLGAFVKHQGQ